jgi:hypothetical protein
MKIPDCTLTTACFDLTSFNKKSRTLEECIKNMKQLLEIPVFLVIYADSNCMNYIKIIRGSYQLDHLTKYVEMDISELPKYQYANLIQQNREKYWPSRDERSSCQSHIIQISKADLVLKTIDSNPFGTSKFGWIDANLGDNNCSKISKNYKNNMLQYVLNNVTDKFHLQILNVCEKKYKTPETRREFYQQYRWIMCGCLFTMTKDIGIKILNRLNEITVEHTLQGYGHAEEMFFLEILDEFYDDIERSYGDYSDILNNFIQPTISFRYIVEMIIKRYNYFGYHRECYDCCKKLIDQIDNYKVEIDYGSYFIILYCYAHSSYYHKGKDYSKNVTNTILRMIQENPYVKREYEKNKEFFDTQFSVILS